MKNVINKKSRLSSLILIVLIAAMVLSLAACGSDEGSANTAGAKSFTFEVVDLDGNTETFELSSTAQYVGEALLAEGLIEGEDSEYGLFVKVVNGITADYDVDGHYWAFYVNGEYGMSGVDTTEIEDGATYSFKVE